MAKPWRTADSRRRWQRQSTRQAASAKANPHAGAPNSQRSGRLTGTKPTPRTKPAHIAQHSHSAAKVSALPSAWRNSWGAKVSPSISTTVSEILPILALRALAPRVAVKTVAALSAS